jgi:hypothetical protein
MATVLVPIEESVGVSCAVEVFLATALLHQEHPDRQDFTIQEIVNRVARENLTGNLRPGIHVHASQHCVANKAPNPLKHRMLFAMGKHTRRLVLPSDIAHPDRTGKIFPDKEDVPEQYYPVLEWARRRFEEAFDSPDFWAKDANERVRQPRSNDLLATGYISMQTGKKDCGAGAGDLAPKEPAIWLGELLDLRLAGAHLADGVDPDEHIRQLREGWE